MADADRRRDSVPAGRTGEHSAAARVSTREALRFLTRAGRLLSASLDVEKTLDRLLRLAVPRIACFAMVDLVRDDGRLERVAWKHVDGDREPLLERTEPFLPEMEGLVPLAGVIATAEPLLVEDVERDWAGGRDTLDKLRSLAGRSLIIVPLTTGDETVGVLTFGSTRTDRFYHEADLTLALELARSAALALDNSRLYQKAEHAIAARDEVLAVVSHDLRNPVSRVRMAAELMTELHELPEGARRTTDMIVRAADEMNRLIGDLLDVTRIEAGRLSIDPAPVALAELLDQLEEAHSSMADEKGIVWVVERPGQPVTMMLDEGRMLQALGNLVGNAIKFTPEGGEVRVVTERTSDGIRIGVRDNGPGMDETQLAHVFDRFWQSRAGDRRGAGLGLAIASGIVAAHGGTIGMDSAVGAGTTAWVELPAGY